jgi:hypothetical protein
MTAPALKTSSEIETLRPARLTRESGIRRVPADDMPLVVPVAERTPLSVHLVTVLIPDHLTLLADSVEARMFTPALLHIRAIRRSAQLVGLARLGAIAAAVEADLVRQDMLDSASWLARLDHAFILGRRALADAAALDPEVG